MKNTEKSSENKKIYKETLSLFWPVALGNLITLSLGISDNFFASRIGGGMVSAVVVGAQVGQLLVFLLNGISGVLLILIARRRARGDDSAILSLGIFGVLLALLLGLIFMIVSRVASAQIVSVFTKDPSVSSAANGYLKSLSLSFPIFAVSAAATALLRGLKLQKISFLASAIALFVNITLNYLVIFRHLFISEANVSILGYSILWARVCELAVLLLGLFIKMRGRLPRSRRLLFLIIISARGFFKIGAPTILGQVVWGINGLFATLVIGRLLSTSALSALSVANLMHNLSYVAINALSLSFGATYSSLLGEGRRDEAGEYAARAELVFLSLGVLSGILIFAFSSPFISIFSLPAESEKIARAFLTVLSVTVVGTSYQSGILYGILRASGETKFAFVLDLIFVFLVIMPFSFGAASGGFAAFAVFAALKCDQILKCPLAARRIRRGGYLKRKGAA